MWKETEIFKFLSIYNSYIDIPKIKKLSNLQLLKELSFYDELYIAKNKSAFNDLAQSYNIEIIDKKDVIIQLKAGEISIKNLFKYLLIEMK